MIISSQSLSTQFIEFSIKKKHAYCYTKKQYTYHQESFKTDGLFIKVIGSIVT
jgi:hypothetical protein